MAELEIRQLKALRDNYDLVLRDSETAATNTVGASEPRMIIAALAPSRHKRRSTS